MGTVYIQNGHWYLRYKNANGRWRGKSCKARTKTEAKSILGDLERLIERQRLGAEQDPALAGTLEELLAWWLETYSTGSASHERNVYAHFAHRDHVVHAS